jgi:hypothetical protein
MVVYQCVHTSACGWVKCVCVLVDASDLYSCALVLATMIPTTTSMKTTSHHPTLKAETKLHLHLQVSVCVCVYVTYGLFTHGVLSEPAEPSAITKRKGFARAVFAEDTAPFPPLSGYLQKRARHGMC